MAKKATGKTFQTQKYQGRPRKEKIVSEWTEKVSKSQAMVFTDYKGMSHMQLETLKKASKKLDAEFVVTKNRLMKIALKSSKTFDTLDTSDTLDTHFNNPTATLFIYGDYIEPIKNLAKTMKEMSLPTVKFGLVEGKPMSASDVAKLATLPGMDQLRAQLVGTLNSPIQGLHRALQWNLQTLVMTLKAIESKKSAS